MSITKRVPAVSGSAVWPVAMIAFLGLAAAGFCFGVLSSKAEVGLAYSAGGAFAGALISWSTLAALYLQFQRSGTVMRDLAKENEDLQHKLLRGAPRPSGFEIEVDERLRLVLARPGDWQPGGGLIFDFQLPHDPEKATDIFPARFRVLTEPIDPDELNAKGDPQAAFYTRLEEASRMELGTRSSSMEIVYTGGQPDEGVKSLRTTSRTYARASVIRDPNKRRPSFAFEYVSEDVFRSYVHSSVAEALQKVRVRQREKGESGDQSDGLAAMAEDATTAEAIAKEVATALEAGSFRHEESLVDAIEKSFLAELGLGASNNGATSTSPRSDSQPFAIQGASRVTSAPATFEVWVEILPIVRTTLVCYHRDLRHVFYFDFADNPADYVASSEVFNQIVRSVRFLI
jgi:hypothetical protein